MPPKAAAEANKTFSAEVLALILAASGTTIGGKDYHIMAKLDETKTASGWEHTFRPIKARAKELKAKIDAGEFGDVAGTPKKSPAKRARKATTEDDEDTPRKKTKKAKKESTGSGSDADAPGSEVAQ